MKWTVSLGMSALGASVVAGGLCAEVFHPATVQATIEEFAMGFLGSLCFLSFLLYLCDQAVEELKKK